MKQLAPTVAVQDVPNEGLISLLNEPVILFCMNYFYAGKLIGVNDDFVLLENGGIVYETGAFSSESWKDFQKIADKLYVRTATIESYARGK